MIGLSVFEEHHLEPVSSLSLIARLVAHYRKARRKEKDAGTTEDPKLYLEEAALERQLPELDLRMLVDLPPGLDYNEWLASHTLALFDHINLVYGTISEFCTMTGCPDMTGPGLRYAFSLIVRYSTLFDIVASVPSISRNVSSKLYIYFNTSLKVKKKIYMKFEGRRVFFRQDFNVLSKSFIDTHQML